MSSKDNRKAEDTGTRNRSDRLAKQTLTTEINKNFYTRQIQIKRIDDNMICEHKLKGQKMQVNQFKLLVLYMCVPAHITGVQMNKNPKNY